MTKRANLSAVRNKILDDITGKKRVISYDDYSEFCTRQQFRRQMQYIKELLGIKARFFNKPCFEHCSAAYEISCL